MSIANVIGVARQQIGKPYVFGSVGPNSFDCSGLVVFSAWRGDNKRLPHFTGSLISLGTAVSKSALQPGDLVFPDSHHVQIYSGNGMVIEAPRTGTNVREVPMWGFLTARRVFSGPAAISGPSGSGGFVTVDNPISKADQLYKDFNKIGDILSDPSTWQRAAYYVGGAILILIGVVLLAGVEGVKKVV